METLLSKRTKQIKDNFNNLSELEENKRIKNIIGYKKDRLEVIGFYKIQDGRTYWFCKCDCGKIVIRQKDTILSKGFKSCNCYKSDKEITHGMSKTRFWRIWQGMCRRCDSVYSSSYDNYGRRGIKVCKRWKNFDNFREDMLSSYLKHCELFSIKQTTIDRINNNKNYGKSNCQWATYKQQNNNRRDNIKQKNKRNKE